MGCLGATVCFEDTPPPVEVLLAALEQYVGEPVYYEAGMNCLSCPSTGDAVGFEAAPVLRRRIPSLDVEYPDSWHLLNTNLKGGYLWFATLVVLQQLGGTCDWKIPSWGFMPWVQAKRESKRLFVRRRSYTYDEARCLGIVK